MESVENSGEESTGESEWDSDDIDDNSKREDSLNTENSDKNEKIEKRFVDAIDDDDDNGEDLLKHITRDDPQAGSSAMTGYDK